MSDILTANPRPPPPLLPTLQGGPRRFIPIPVETILDAIAEQQLIAKPILFAVEDELSRHVPQRLHFARRGRRLP